ncbi:discoidin domain-containing protein [Arthrobacter sp. Sr24]
MLLLSQSTASDLLPAIQALPVLPANGATGAEFRSATSGPLSVRSEMFNGKFSMTHATSGTDIAAPAVAQGTSAQTTFRSKPRLSPSAAVELAATLTSGGATLSAGYSMVVTDSRISPCVDVSEIRVSTPWHTTWSVGSIPTPHWANIDLGSTMTLNAAGCTPPHQLNGRITRASMATSMDGTNNNKWVTCQEFSVKKEVTEDTTPTEPAEGMLTQVLCWAMTVT